MPRSKRPETMRAKATRSRWALFMLACTLNTKAVNGCSARTSPLPASGRGPGAGAKSRNSSRNSDTPKLFTAEPKNIGDCSPRRKASRSKAGRTWSISSTSSLSCCSSAAVSRAAISGSSRPPFPATRAFWPALARSKTWIWPVART